MENNCQEKVALVVEIGIDFWVPEIKNQLFKVYSWIINEICNTDYNILLKPNNQLTIIFLNIDSDEYEYLIAEKIKNLKANFKIKFTDINCSIGFAESKISGDYTLRNSMMLAEYNMYKERKAVLETGSDEKRIGHFIDKFRFFLNSMITGDYGEYSRGKIIEASEELDELIYKHYKG